MNQKRSTSRTTAIVKRNSKPSSPLHPRSPHRGRYDFNKLVKANESLDQFIIQNPSGDKTIDFSDNKAVRALNKALLTYYYHINYWDIPDNYLCPPIPGRADYIHYLADLLEDTHGQPTPKGKHVNVLDIGTGANCIYPIIGSQSYGWHFVGTDIDPISVNTANLIISSNPCLTNKVKISLQTDSNHIFKGVIQSHHRFSLTLCNPPFNASLKEAHDNNQRKWKNLNKGRLKQKRTGANQSALNFGGQKAELWCSGGEIAFLKRMTNESVIFAKQVCWFTTLISKGDNLKPTKDRLYKLGAKQVKVVNMSQGQKVSRFIAWSFLTKEEQQAWTKKYRES